MNIKTILIALYAVVVTFMYFTKETEVIELGCDEQLEDNQKHQDTKAINSASKEKAAMLSQNADTADIADVDAVENDSIGQHSEVETEEDDSAQGNTEPKEILAHDLFTPDSMMNLTKTMSMANSNEFYELLRQSLNPETQTEIEGDYQLKQLLEDVNELWKYSNEMGCANGICVVSVTGVTNEESEMLTSQILNTLGDNFGSRASSTIPEAEGTVHLRIIIVQDMNNNGVVLDHP